MITALFFSEFYLLDTNSLVGCFFIHVLSLICFLTVNSMGNERSNKNFILRHQRLEFLTAMNSTFSPPSDENLRIFREAGDQK